MEISKKDQTAIDAAIAAAEQRTLTYKLAQSLFGKRIITKYFGYKGQDGYNAFNVGKIVLEHTTWGNNDPKYHAEKAAQNPREYFNKVTLLDEFGDETYITGYFNPETGDCDFWCSDEDRWVYFIESSEAGRFLAEPVCDLTAVLSEGQLRGFFSKTEEYVVKPTEKADQYQLWYKDEVYITIYQPTVQVLIRDIDQLAYLRRKSKS